MMEVARSTVGGEEESGEGEEVSGVDAMREYYSLSCDVIFQATFWPRKY